MVPSLVLSTVVVFELLSGRVPVVVVVLSETLVETSKLGQRNSTAKEGKPHCYLVRFNALNM